MQKKVLVIISACNEAVSLDVFLPKLFANITSLSGRLSVTCDVLLISDGSTDNTADVAVKHGCYVITNVHNLGIGTSLRLGYKKALDENYDFTVTLDADGQHDAALLENILQPLLEDKTDIIIASRYHKDSQRMGVPLDRDLLNISVTAQMKVVTGWDLTDPLSGFWGMTRYCFEFALNNGTQGRYGIHIENLIKFWHLCSPRPRHMEIAHPAIYKNGGTYALLTREYSPANQEERIDRFGTHAHHIVTSLMQVADVLGDGVINTIQVKPR